MDIREGRFLCSSAKCKQLRAREIVAELMNTEHEIKTFCNDNGIYAKGDNANMYR